MSTNYNILIKSEKKLKELISEYVFLLLEIHTKLWKDVFLNEKNLNVVLDNCERRLKRSNVMENELVDECIWTISKDDPRANHLRFIISIIYSTKDLSRACEYSQSMAKIIVRNKFDKNSLSLFKPCSKFYLDHIEQMIKIYKSSSNDKFEKLNQKNSEFEFNIEKFQKEIRKSFEKNEVMQYHAMQICRLIISTIERLQTIIFSVLFSKKSNFTSPEIKKPNKNK